MKMEKIKMVKYIFLLVISGFVTYLAQGSLPDASYSNYKEVLGALLNISSIIFAIIGAWIAIIYPRAIGKVFGDKSAIASKLAEAQQDAGYLSELVEIVLVSAVVLMVVLIIQFTFPLVNEMLLKTDQQYIKTIVFFVITTITFAQLQAIFRVILTNYFFLNEIRNKNKNDKIDDLHS
jgi:hypothetical protein